MLHAVGIEGFSFLRNTEFPSSSSSNNIHIEIFLELLILGNTQAVYKT